MPDSLLERLGALVGPDNVLGGVECSPYVAGGRTPEAVVFPGSAEEVAAVVILAAERELAVVPWGGGTAGAVGLPAPRPAIVLGLRRLHRLVEHEPGDLTATVEAGATVAALQGALRSRGQWLSLDPPDAARATIGGVLAANASGPRRQLYGTARDLLIGVTVVTADGTIVKGGGKVVKNVAGYDLPKLFIGSHGTLGVILEATLKLRPVADAEFLLGVSFDRIKDAAAAARALLGSDLIPNAVELLDAPAAAALAPTEAPGAAAAPLLVVGFDGLAQQVEWQAAELRQLAAQHGGRAPALLPPAAWPRLAAAAASAFPLVSAVMTFSVLPTQVAELMEQGAAAARARGFSTAWAAHAGVGVATAALAADREGEEPARVAAALAEWRAIARASAGYATLDRAPLAVTALVPVWDDLGAAGRLMQRIKAQLDPRNILNPGRFVAGI